MFLCTNTNYLKHKGNSPIFSSIKHQKTLRNKGNQDKKYLYNENAQVISDKVFLGINANENEWIVITEEQKVEIEKQLYEELEVE